MPALAPQANLCAAVGVLREHRPAFCRHGGKQLGPCPLRPCPLALGTPPMAGGDVAWGGVEPVPILALHCHLPPCRHILGEGSRSLLRQRVEEPFSRPSAGFPHPQAAAVRAPCSAADAVWGCVPLVPQAAPDRDLCRRRGVRREGCSSPLPYGIEEPGLRRVVGFLPCLRGFFCGLSHVCSIPECRLFSTPSVGFNIKPN